MSKNLLDQETSPYLLQHKDNPVHWRPWGRAALEEAQETGKPILLSVGYAACHWCHVMAHESFEDPHTAGVMNQLFVNIKVDREERPDIDHIYMSALQALSQQGGWPLTMFLTPEGAPVWGGTYFPKEERYGQPAFTDVLESVAATFRQDPDRINHNHQALMEHLSKPPVSRETSEPLILETVMEKILSFMDNEHGGVRGAPKFPQAPLTGFLLRSYYRTGDQAALDEVIRALRHMSQGGIYDHLGGGLARYSVDSRWLAPHFEKMLSDNAQYIDLLTTLYLETGEALFRNRIEETVGFLISHMQSPDGAFYASFDADSDGREGAYYVWQKSEIEELLGAEEAALFCTHYDVSENGNWEETNILNRLNDLHLTDAETETRLLKSRAVLLEHRAKRNPPGRDDKHLADWNGLAISALAHAGIALAQPSWIEAAEKAFDYFADYAAADGRPPHSVCQNIPVHPALSTDLALMIQAALALSRATAIPVYLETAETWTGLINQHYWDEESGSFYLSAADADDIILRSRSIGDAAVPSTEGIQTANLIRLWLLTGQTKYRDQTDTLLKLAVPAAEANLFSATSLLSALDFRLRPIQLVILRQSADRDADLIRTAHKLPQPNLVYFEAESTSGLAAEHPASGKTMIDDQPTAYVCIGQSCSLPITDANQLAKQVNTSIA